MSETTLQVRLSTRDRDELLRRLGCSDDDELAEAVSQQLGRKLSDYRTHREPPKLTDDELERLREGWERGAAEVLKLPLPHPSTPMLWVAVRHESGSISRWTALRYFRIAGSWGASQDHLNVDAATVLDWIVRGYVSEVMEALLTESSSDGSGLRGAGLAALRALRALELDVEAWDEEAGAELRKLGTHLEKDVEAWPTA